MNNKNYLKWLVLAFAIGFAQVASAYPYLVYKGTLSTTSSMDPTESADITTLVGSDNNDHSKLKAAVLKYLKASGGSTSSAVYLVTDEADQSNYTFLVIDPTGGKVRIAPITAANLTSDQLQNNFINGFFLNDTTGVGVFRFAFQHSIGTDKASNRPGSYVLQVYGTGPINASPTFQLAPKRAALTFKVTKGGIVQSTINLPAVPAIFSSNPFIPSVTGQVFGYLLEDGNPKLATKKGTFTLALNTTLTQLANVGGEYKAGTKDVGNIPAIPHPLVDPPAISFQTFIQNILNAYPPQS